MNKTQNNIPALRFPEFKGKWEKKKLGDIYTFKVSNSFSRENLNYEDGLVKNIHYGDIHTKFQTLFDITKESVPFIKPEISIERISENNYCQVGDVILADASEDLHDVGKSIELVNLNNEKLLSGLHTILARPTSEKLSVGFGGYLFKSNKIRTQIQKESQGSKVLSISPTRLSNINLTFPNKKEQTRIASFLTTVDQKLTQLKQKKTLLEQYKKGVMQKLFNASELGLEGLQDDRMNTNKNNEILKSSNPKNPNSDRLRFKDENGKVFPNWEEKKLSSFMVERKIQEPKNEKYPLMAFVANKGVVHKGDRYNREFLVNDEENKKYKQTEFGDFIYSSNNLETGSIGLNNYGSASISPVYSIFKIEELCNYQFISRFLTSKEFIGKMIKYRQGVVYGQWKIHETAFLQIKVKLPSHKEQTKIANFLSAIDEKINHCQVQIEKTEGWKKGLLQRMFV